VREGVRLCAGMGAAPGDDALPAWSDLAPLLAQPEPRPMTLSFRWVPVLAAGMLLAVGQALCRQPASASRLEEAALTAHRSAVVVPGGDDAGLRRWLSEQGLNAVWPRALAGRTVVGGIPLAGGAAAVSFNYQGAPVTLAVARAEGPAAPKRVAYRLIDDLQVARWTSGGQSYVLVSPLRGEAPCAVCHGERG
jgi:hypothetical protein